MLILDLWGISFHAVVVFGLGKNLSFKSILGRCVMGTPSNDDELGKMQKVTQTKLSFCQQSYSLVSGDRVS